MKTKSAGTYIELLILRAKPFLWDVIIIIFFLLIFLFIKYSLINYGNESYKSTFQYDIINVPDYDFTFSRNNLPNNKNIRNIFNFNIETDKPNEIELKDEAAKVQEKETNQEDILYGGLVSIGKNIAVCLSINGKYYVISEGDTIENKYKLLKANAEYLEIVLLNNNLHKRINNEYAKEKY